MNSLYEEAIARGSRIGAGMPMQGGRHLLRFMNRVSTAPNGLFNGLIWPNVG